MKTITTKEELRAALEAKTDKILIKGELVNKIQNKIKMKKQLKNGSIAVGIAAIAAPFTGGSSLLALTAATTGTAISSVAIYAVLGGLLGLCSLAIFKGYDVKFTEGTTGSTIELTKKREACSK